MVIKRFLTKNANPSKKTKKRQKSKRRGILTLPLVFRFFIKKRTKNMYFVPLLGSSKCHTGAGNIACCCNNDCGNNSNQQVETSIALTVTALARKYVYQQNEPADYGNAVQNTAPEVAPRREGSVRLRQKHIRCFGIDSLFHVFSPFLRTMPKYYTYSIPLFSFFDKGFFNIFLFFHKKTSFAHKNEEIRGCTPYKRHRQGSSKSGVRPPKRDMNARCSLWEWKRSRD